VSRRSEIGQIARSIVLDTNDLVHGRQQLALFSANPGGHCFQPIQLRQSRARIA
jgi:hypothetical protein